MSDIMNVCSSGHWPSHLERFSLLDLYQVLFDSKSQKIPIEKLWFPSRQREQFGKLRSIILWRGTWKRININFSDILFPDKTWQQQQKGLRATKRIMIPKSILLIFFKIPEFLAHLVNLHKMSKTNPRSCSLVSFMYKKLKISMYVLSFLGVALFVVFFSSLKLFYIPLQVCLNKIF